MRVSNTSRLPKDTSARPNSRAAVSYNSCRLGSGGRAVSVADNINSRSVDNFITPFNDRISAFGSLNDATGFSSRH
jgi:hypothetical protein